MAVGAIPPPLFFERRRHFSAIGSSAVGLTFASVFPRVLIANVKS